MTRKAEKIQPLGVCDLCLGEIPSTLGNYTSKGRPRLHCSTVCRQTANSRAGNEERIKKVRGRVARGEFVRPDTITKPDPANIGRAAKATRLREVAEDRWRNPALTPEAREFLSKPRKHSGALASAIDRLKRGAKVSDLTPEEQEAHRAYRRELRTARHEDVKAWHRERYKRKQAEMTPEQREAQREKWRQRNRRKAQRKRGQK